MGCIKYQVSSDVWQVGVLPGLAWLGSSYMREHLEGWKTPNVELLKTIFTLCKNIDGLFVLSL